MKRLDLEAAILARVSIPAVYESLAEEASELAHAALKCARALRGENPTPVSAEAARMMAAEEYCDVYNAARTLGIFVDPDLAIGKMERWAARLAPEAPEPAPLPGPAITSDTEAQLRIDLMEADARLRRMCERRRRFGEMDIPPEKERLRRQIIYQYDRDIADTSRLIDMLEANLEGLAGAGTQQE